MLLLQLRLRGFVNLTSGETTLDPLAIIFPALLLFTGALVLLRLFPYVLRLVGWLFTKPRSMAMALTGWHLGRNPVPYGAHSTVHTLSGGEQQRLALCVALAPGPKLLLADELTGELDTETSIEMFNLLRTLSHEGGLSVMVVTHDVAIAQRTDWVVRIADGRIATQTRLGSSELVSIDQRGMVQLPRGMMIESGITDHVRVKLIREGILLEPEEVDDES